MPTTFAPGIRPVDQVTADHIDCPNRRYQCAWGYSHTYIGPGNKEGFFWLKFINSGCRKHGSIPHTRTPEIRYGSSFKAPASRNKGLYR
jgi:hypothetical protein